MTQFNLSGALEELGRDEASPAHLLAAVDAANAALAVWTRQNDPLAWAKTHYALGNALQSLGDRAQDTKSYSKAAASYEQALQVFGRDSAPAEWLLTTKHYALTLQNWGERETGPEHLTAAVAQWQAALAATPLADSPQEFGRLNFNLGLCLENLDDRGQAGAMDGSIAAFRAALTGYTRQQSPADWADTQLRLGFALHAQASKIDGETEELDQAITAYEAAQEIKTKAGDPFGWAELENYIGSARGLIGVRSNDKATLQQGRDDIAAAWEVYKSRDDSYDADFKQRLSQFDAAIASMP
jgi:tetratricopeptide (TPR) repeat protein